MSKLVGTGGGVSKSIKVSYSSNVVKRVKTKEKLLKGLIKKMAKKFPEHVKVVLELNVMYKIIAAKVEKTKYSDVIVIDVVPCLGGDTVVTYFTALVTDQFIEYFKSEGVSLKNTPEILVDLCFLYKGEVTSQEGNKYSDIELTEEDGECKLQV